MRNKIVHFGANEQHYEIREIVKIAQNISKITKKEIVWENIGDPVIKGEKIPDWLKNIVKKGVKEDLTYGYCPSKGILETREYLAKKNKKIGPEDIIFFNGLGEAINKIYGLLHTSARVLGPSPAYPTHSSSEASHAGSFHLTYKLNADNEWNPNLEEIEKQVKYNPNISAILVINPDNPTGAVFSKKILEGIITIAKKYNLFVIFDEIYEKLTFEEKDHTLLRDIIGDVCGIAMKGLSKEVPWPGSRCGRIEIYNNKNDEEFSKYIESIFFSKMLEVCSTTLPQALLPRIYEEPEFQRHLKHRIEKYKKNANIAQEILGKIPILQIIKPKGAYYLTVLFNESQINKKAIDIISNKELKNYITEISKEVSIDKKVCYILLAQSSICTVPMSGFNCKKSGFRITLLEEDEEVFREILKNILQVFNEIKI